MKDYQESENGKETLDQFERSSRQLAYHLTEQQVNEAIVWDPNLAKDADQKKEILFEKDYQTILKGLKDSFIQFTNLGEILKPYYNKTPKEKQEILDEDFDKLTTAEDAWLEEGNTFQEKCKVREETLFWLYDLSQELIHQKEFDQAMLVLNFLNLLNPLISESWFLLGYCFHKKKELENALKSYGTAMILNPEDPQVRLFSAECYLALKMKDDAKIDLEEAENILKNDPNKEKFQPFLKSLKAKLAVVV